MLDEANGRHPNIKLTRQIGTSLPFLDLLLENQNGILTTSVYHKTAAEPYLVPFASDHPRHIFTNIIETALLRALRYSSTWSTFDSERRSIQLMLLYNGYVSVMTDYIYFSIRLISSSRYPLRFIYNNMKKFFKKYLNLSQQHLLEEIQDENQYEATRFELLQKPTSLEHQVLSRIASINNVAPAQAIEKKKKRDRRLIIHYYYERRFVTLPRDIHQLWTDLFKNTSVNDSRLIVGHKNNRNTKRELIHIRPRPSTSSKPKIKNT